MDGWVSLLSFHVSPHAYPQVDYTLRGQGPIACAQRVVSTLGVRHGLYRGWLPTALCRMSNYAYFGAYAQVFV